MDAWMCAVKKKKLDPLLVDLLLLMEPGERVLFLLTLFFQHILMPNWQEAARKNYLICYS